MTDAKKFRLLLLVYLNAILWSFIVGTIRNFRKTYRIVRVDELKSLSDFGRYYAETHPVR